MLSLTAMPHFGIGHRACFFCFGETLTPMYSVRYLSDGLSAFRFSSLNVLSVKGHVDKVRARERRRRTAGEPREGRGIAVRRL